MLMEREEGWNLMFMAQAFLVDTQQSGPRGSDKLYSTNWGMVSAGHPLGGGSVLLKTMLSLEPATVTDRRYPELFQTGETAYGIPLVNAQHPHNFVMELSAQYAHPLGANAMLNLYYAPVGDPALGPVAFPHRASAAEIPQAPLGHHWQDSTHIADNVATAGIQYKWVKLEASGFYGTEPGENRWTIDWGPMNSYSARLWVFPNRSWAAQASVGRLAHPERESAGDIVRATASISYSRRMGDNAWSTSLIWGRNHETLTGRNLNSYLLESVYPIGTRNFVTGRIELVDKDELFADQPELEQQLDRTAGSTFRVQEYLAGYTHDIVADDHVEVGLGFNVSLFAIPAAIQPYYGNRPAAGSVFLRVRLR
jgi:hypothetical protein